MWTWKQTGQLIAPDGTVVPANPAYSGFQDGKNNPQFQDVPNVGPIPRGTYTILFPRATVQHGPYVLPLVPAPSNEMHGRSGFLIHGDSIKAPGTASHGCIILPRNVREAIWGSGDKELTVC